MVIPDLIGNLTLQNLAIHWIPAFAGMRNKEIMRIGIDVRALMEGKITGVQVYIVNLLNALFTLDQKNHYVLFANSFGDVKDRIQLFDYPNVEYRIFRYPNKLFNLAQKFLCYPKIDKLLGGLDLFFSPHWRVLALNRRVPLVVTFHDLSFEITPEFFTLWQRFWHRFMGYRAAAKRARKLLAVSESTKNDLIKIYDVPAERIQVLHSGVSLMGAGEPIEHLPAEYFLSFSTFEPRKNLESVLAAYREYHKASAVKLPLVLAGNPGWKTKIQVPKSLASSVVVLQSVTNGQKTYLYKNAFALVFLSFYEGFGFPILEAASQGVPVISSLATSLQEIGHSFAQLVNPFRPSQVSAAMLALEQDRNLYAELSLAGLKAASSYSWERTASGALKLFEQIYANRN